SNVFVADNAGGRIGRAFAGDRVIERGAQRIDIGPGTLATGGGGVLLVGTVARFHERAHRARVRGDLTARRSEVDQHRRPVLAHHNVVGRDVAMEEVRLVNDL